jgi:hypothetical protein
MRDDCGKQSTLPEKVGNQAATTLAEMGLKMRNCNAEASAITSGEGQVAKREDS